jgi:hypothetical protein
MAVSGARQAARARPGLSARQLAALRGASFGALVMLVVQVAIGTAVNLYVTVPAADKGSGVLTAVGRALTKGPAALAVHAGLGLLLILAAAGLVVRALQARHTAVLMLSVVGLLAIVAAAVSGARFVSAEAGSASLAMALSTAVGLLCYAISLFVLGSTTPGAGEGTG